MERAHCIEHLFGAQMRGRSVLSEDARKASAGEGEPDTAGRPHSANSRCRLMLQPIAPSPWRMPYTSLILISSACCFDFYP